MSLYGLVTVYLHDSIESTRPDSRCVHSAMPHTNTNTHQNLFRIIWKDSYKYIPYLLSDSNCSFSYSFFLLLCSTLFPSIFRFCTLNSSNCCGLTSAEKKMFDGVCLEFSFHLALYMEWCFSHFDFLFTFIPTVYLYAVIWAAFQMNRYVNVCFFCDSFCFGHWHGGLFRFSYRT